MEVDLDGTGYHAHLWLDCCGGYHFNRPYGDSDSRERPIFWSVRLLVLDHKQLSARASLLGIFFVSHVPYAMYVVHMTYNSVGVRVRGNLVIVDSRWHLQFVPRGESWRLQIGRDIIDASMLRVATHMVWCVLRFFVERRYVP